MAIIVLNSNNIIIQSPQIYCQAVGSNGENQTIVGNLVRWDLMGKLGDRHIPKCDLAVSTNGQFEGYNKSDDVVRLYRSLYNHSNPIVIDFGSFDTGGYTFLPNDSGLLIDMSSTNGNKVIIRFIDKAQFSYLFKILGSIPFSVFLNNYTGVIEIEVEDKLIYKYGILCGLTTGIGHSLFETISYFDNPEDYGGRPNPSLNENIVKREIKQSGELNNNSFETVGENIKFIRIQQVDMTSTFTVVLYPYEDLFNELQANQSWQECGKFGLSLDTKEVFSRFQRETYSGGDLNLIWSNFNNPINANNYKIRFNLPEDGLKALIQKFIEITNIDPSNFGGNLFIPIETFENDGNGITISLLDVIRLISSDYHVARMLGLGYLDKEVDDQKYIYAIKYSTFDYNTSIGKDHIYLTLPTNIYDTRSPQIPVLDELSYGLYLRQDSNSEEQLYSSETGYSLIDNIRYVNINRIINDERREINVEIPNSDFFDLTQTTTSSNFGIKYKLNTEESWSEPDILFDEEFYEPITIPNNGEVKLYTHGEKIEGLHRYAIYAANWFNRFSLLSNFKDTDETLFTNLNRLLPPSNISVQYILEENPLILTTQEEQSNLELAKLANPTADNYKTRIIFEWNNVHINSYNKTDKVEFYFRDVLPNKIECIIEKVISISDYECEIQTKPFVQNSSNPPITSDFKIGPGEEYKYLGSNLSTISGQFLIASISQDANFIKGPTFIVKKNKISEPFQLESNTPLIISPTFVSPKINEVAFTQENTDNVGNWIKLQKTVNLIKFSDTIEIVYDEDGVPHNELVGGISANATITEVINSNGGYTISFNNGINLAAHPDPSVKWFKGSARFILALNQYKRKKLSVVSIITLSPIKLAIFDYDYLALPNERIKTGSNINVNFHPGYKLYLSAEPNIFDKNKILPVNGSNLKTTYISVRSIDSINNKFSSLSSNLSLIARNVQLPITPNIIVPSVYATRPDFYGKSSFTLDFELNTIGRYPYGLNVYRANHTSILKALYKASTLEEILAELVSSTDTQLEINNSWDGLFNAITSDNLKFTQFGSFRFPLPDNDKTKYLNSENLIIYPFPIFDLSEINQTLIKKVIEQVFISLTDSPIIFDFLKIGYQTSSALPNSKNNIGKLLDPSDPLFNPFPMAVKFPVINPNIVRFTDYRLNGNSENIYFYFAKEIALNGKLSDRTSVSDPVMVVNSTPAEKPTIRKIVTHEVNSIENLSPSIEFEIAEYLKSEKINKYQIFRSTSIANSTSVNLMTKLDPISIEDIVQDTFEDLDFPPFGQPLFYRITALREIINERGEVELIASQPSEMILTNIIDSSNPEAPTITPTIGSTIIINGIVTSLSNVSLMWSQTVYNGTYYVYKMNGFGNWEKLWTKKTNNAQITFPENGDFLNFPIMSSLSKIDNEGNVIYHRFKVSVENASGLFNIEEKDLII